MAYSLGKCLAYVFKCMINNLAEIRIDLHKDCGVKKQVIMY